MANLSLFYSVLDYGAVGDGSTDDTAAIQAAITAWTAGGSNGKVYFPYTGNDYIIGGALVTSVDGVNPNCQIYIPKDTVQSGTNKTLILEAEVPMNAIIGGNSSREFTGGVVLRSTILGSGTAPAVLGASFNSSGGGGTTNFTHIDVICINMTIKVRSKTSSTHIAPTMTAFDFSKVGAVSLYQCTAVTQSAPTVSVQPTDATVAGFKLPGQLNSSSGLGTVLDCVSAGFYSGMELTEHTKVINVHCTACVRGLYFRTSDNHPVHVFKYFCDGSIHPIEFEGNTSVIIDIFEFEASNTNWFDTTTMIYAAGAAAVKGTINFWSLTAFSISSTITSLTVTDFGNSPANWREYSPSATFGGVVYRRMMGSDNAAMSVNIMPKGTGASATLKSQLVIWNSDGVADGTNTARLDIRGGGTNGYTIDSQNAGSGTLRPITWQMNGTAYLFFDTTGRVTVGSAGTPTARLHIAAGTATASTAPLKFTSGTNLTTAEAGAMEYNGTNLFFTRSGTTRENIVCASAVTTEVIVADTSVTININGTTYKLLARA